MYIYVRWALCCIKKPKFFKAKSFFALSIKFSNKKLIFGINVLCLNRIKIQWVFTFFKRLLLLMLRRLINF
jgi:hypothetical protein